MSTYTAFDADVLIYAATQNHPLGSRVARLFANPEQHSVGTGCVLLLTEVLTKPMRKNPESDESLALLSLLSRLDLHPVDEPTARLSLALAMTYRLRTADAAHLASAVAAGADSFLTNNSKDFPKTISEINIIYPDDLP